MKGLAILLAGCATVSAQAASAQPWTSQAVADLFTARNWDRLKAVSADERMVLVEGVAAAPKFSPITRDQFLDAVRGCLVTDVFAKGVNYQRWDAIGFICPDEPIGSDACEVVGYGVELELSDTVRFRRAHRFTDWNKAKCGPQPILLPPPPAPPSNPSSSN